MRTGSAFLLVLTGVLVSGGELLSEEPSRSVPGAPSGWQATAPRDEIRPEFIFEPKGGPNGAECFVIKADAREGLDGAWVRTFPVTGGKSYRFSALYKAASVSLERRSIVAKLDWEDASGKSVPTDQPTVANYLRGSIGMAETEFPRLIPPQVTTGPKYPTLTGRRVVRQKR